MHSFARAIAVAVMSTLVVVFVSAQGGEIVEGFTDLSSTAGTRFIDREYRALDSLTEGPYSAFATSNYSPVFASGLGSLEKRQDCNGGCDAGYGCCSNSAPGRVGVAVLIFLSPAVMETAVLISVVNQTGNARAPLRLRLVVGPFAANMDVQDLIVESQCACPTTYPVTCPDMTCCGSGQTCVNTGNNVYQCQKGNIIAPTSAPQPTSGNSGNGTDGGIQAGGIATAAGNSLERTSGSVAVLIAIVAIFLA
ncbi:MAG: hypothetical protein J3Q66DRAFT_420414 [Benniella sp.]|nr:MAG: hypothetical protein J3Q66DRAFT_420414 [Benniella sp.]